MNFSQVFLGVFTKSLEKLFFQLPLGYFSINFMKLDIHCEDRPLYYNDHNHVFKLLRDPLSKTRDKSKFSLRVAITLETPWNLKFIELNYRLTNPS